MVLLHIQLTSDTLISGSTHKHTVSIAHSIPSQVMTLKKSVIVQKYNATGANTNHTVFVDLNFLSHYEVSSTTGEMELPLTFDPTVNRTDAEYHIKLKAEAVPKKFSIGVFKDASRTPFPFGSDNNKLQQIDLFLEYETNDMLQ